MNTNGWIGPVIAGARQHHSHTLISDPFYFATLDSQRESLRYHLGIPLRVPPQQLRGRSFSKFCDDAPRRTQMKQGVISNDRLRAKASRQLEFDRGL